MSIEKTLLDAAALGIFRRLFRLERQRQHEFDFTATADGPQAIPIDVAAHSISVFVNGVRQSGSSLLAGSGSVKIPVQMGIVSGDVLTITYWK